MAFPFAHHSNWEDGTVTEWTSETDTESKLNVRHYSWLAQNIGLPDAIPYLGAYCAHINLLLGTADAYVQEDTNLDIALGGTLYVRFYCWVGALTMAASDRFTILTLQSAGPVDEVTVGIVNDAGVLKWVVAETGATALGAGTRLSGLSQQQWHCIEVAVTLDSGANDGTITAFVDGRQVGAALTGLTQAAVIQARLGAIGIDATTTAGHLLFDEIVADDTRVGVLSKRFAEDRMLYKSGHVLLGPGSIIEADVLRSLAVGDEEAALYDTDTADITDASRRIFVFNDSHKLQVTRGIYAVLTGTQPILGVKIHEALDMSEGQIRELGRLRQAV